MKASCSVVAALLSAALLAACGGSAIGVSRFSGSPAEKMLLVSQPHVARNRAPYRTAPGGRLYVANYGGPGVSGSVTVYSPAGKSLLRKITQGISEPSSLAFDASGNLGRIVNRLNLAELVGRYGGRRRP